jgi:hypothetical protein
MVETIRQLLDYPGMITFVNGHDWVWPLCEMIHYIGMSLIIGIIGMLDLRILGYGKGIPPAAINKLVPVAIIAFVANLVTGLVFITGNPAGGPEAYLSNLSFQLKMGSVLLAGLNLAYFYVSGLERKVVAMPGGGNAPAGAKAVALLSIIFWLSVIFFGRMLMYNDTLLLLFNM